MNVSSEIEVIARRIAFEHDIDPDDARLGYPAWRISWILELAESELYQREKQSK